MTTAPTAERAVVITRPTPPADLPYAECAVCGSPFHDTTTGTRRHQYLFGHLPGRRRRNVDLSRWNFTDFSRVRGQKTPPNKCTVRVSNRRSHGSLRAKVLEGMLREEGQRTIAARLGVSPGSVGTTVARLRQSGDLPPPGRSAPPAHSLTPTRTAIGTHPTKERP